MGLATGDIGAHVRLELDDPDRLNPIGDAFWDGFSAAVDALRAADGVRTVRLTGRGRAFSAGGDIRRMRELAVAARDGRLSSEALAVERDRLVRAHAVLRDWVALPAVRVAGINGPAVGAGLALALTCDRRVMAADAWLDTGFANLGLPGDCGITYFLPRLIGEHRAHRWLEEPRRIGADEALALGLVDEVVDAEALGEALEATVQRLGRRSAEASRWIRRPTERAAELAHALDRELEATVACKATAFYADAVRSFFGDRSTADGTTR